MDDAHCQLRPQLLRPGFHALGRQWGEAPAPLRKTPELQGEASVETKTQGQPSAHVSHFFVPHYEVVFESD